MLSVDHLTVYRGGRLVLDGVSFTLRPGQVTAVLGLNGAGKTTLLKAILGFLPRQAGELTADGRSLDKLSPADRAKKLAYVPQRYDGGFRYRAEEFVSMGATAYLGAFSRPGRREEARAEALLRGLDCDHLVGRPMDRLSGGEQRMAYLARAMMQDAGCLLLDEPVSSLDLSRQHRFLHRLGRYVEERRAGCLVTIHAPELAYAYAGRILILHQGRVLLDASRGKPGYEARLARALGAIYGPGLRTDFREGRLALGWDHGAETP